MPLLYGEHDQAFIRLQEEILKTTHDHSIFAWDEQKPGQQSYERARLLAHLPRCFAGCEDVVTWSSGTELPFTVTNMGLDITFLHPSDSTDVPDESTAILQCRHSDDWNNLLALHLSKRLATGHREVCYNLDANNIQNRVQTFKLHCDKSLVALRSVIPRDSRPNSYYTETTRSPSEDIQLWLRTHCQKLSINALLPDGAWSVKNVNTLVCTCTKFSGFRDLGSPGWWHWILPSMVTICSPTSHLLA